MGMRCLQCGKNVPLLKRLAASEFCSEAHRRDYQQEYSQLALSRLLQSKPAEAQAQQVKPPLEAASAPAIVEPPAVSGGTAMNGAATAKPGAAPGRIEKAHPATTPSAPAAKPNGIAKSHPPPAISKKAVPLPAASQPAASQPATARAAVIQKPAPAELQFAPAAAPKVEHAFAALAPGRPRRQAHRLPAALPQGRAIALESRVEIVDSLLRPIESKLDLREVPRTTPRIALDLRIVPPESLETEGRPLTIPVAPVAAAQASLWVGPHYDLAGEVISLSDFASAQFSKSGFETPPLAGSSAVSRVVEPLPPEPQPAAMQSEPPPHETDASRTASETSAPTPTVRVPDPELNPLPVNSPGIAPGRGKPLPVFGPAPAKAGTVQIPQPSSLPLRPVIVLATAAMSGAKNRESDAGSLRSDLSVTPPLQQSETSVPLSPEPNPGLPEPQIQTPAGAWASRMRKLLAPLAGAAVLGTGILFFAGKQSNAGSKSPVPMLTDGALGGQWIANFAPDARRQRRVSLLQSSVNLPAYRLDFESSIQVKALGWVTAQRTPRISTSAKSNCRSPDKVSPMRWCTMPSSMGWNSRARKRPCL